MKVVMQRNNLKLQNGWKIECSPGQIPIAVDIDNASLCSGAVSGGRCHILWIYIHQYGIMYTVSAAVL